MLLATRFYTTKRCVWCGVRCDHYVDFEIYLPKEDKVFYKLTCSYCYDRACVSKDNTYNYTRYETNSMRWNEWIPKMYGLTLN
jgi:hypothetical protein